MNRADHVFALFVEANPVPDATTVAERPRFQPVAQQPEGSADMRTSPTRLAPPSRAPRRWKRIVPALVAAAVIAWKLRRHVVRQFRPRGIGPQVNSSLRRWGFCHSNSLEKRKNRKRQPFHYIQEGGNGNGKPRKGVWGG